MSLLSVREVRSRVVLAFLAMSFAVAAQLPPVDGTSRLDDVPAHLHVASETVLSLNGAWTLVADPAAVGLDDTWVAPLTAGEAPFEGAEVFEVAVPGALEQVKSLVSYDGVVWQARTFAAPDAWPDGRLRLHFERVNYACRVWLDGRWLGDHEGGYAPFSFDVSRGCRPGEEHRLVVMVVDPGAVETFGFTLSTTPHAKESWYHNWGGIVGGVSLRVVPTYRPIAPWLRHGPEGTVEVRPTLERSDGESAAAPEVTLIVRTSDGEEVASASSIDLSWTGQARLPHVKAVPGATPLAAWRPSSPALYEFELLVGDETIARVSTAPRTALLDEHGFHLNGARRVPKAVLYQPHHTGLGGVPPTAEELDAEVRAILGAGFDMARVHVAPAEPAFLDAADRHGLMVLEEPAIGWVNEAPPLRDRLEREVAWMVDRDQHRASIVMWGALNELSGRAYLHAVPLMDVFARHDRSRAVLEDSGGFFRGGRYWPAFGAELPSSLRRPMVDEHYYPPYPLPPGERARLATGEIDGGPTFASEFGYGTLVDAAPVNAEFVARDIWSDERILFGGMRGASRRARRAGDGWTTDRVRGWIDAAHELHADAAEDMVDALRSNPKLALLCYTQWRSVSKEPSAGVVSAWGEKRPVYERLVEALEPVSIIVEPQRPSWAPGDTAAWDVHVVNDMAEAFSGEVALVDHDAGSLHFTRDGTFEPGITTMRFEVDIGRFAPNMTFKMVAVVASDDFAIRDASAPRTTRVIASRALTNRHGRKVEPEDVRVWTPGDATDALEFAERMGFAITMPGAGAQVALITRPQDLATSVSFADRLRLWHFVRDGGVALVLAENPLDTELGRMLGVARGVSTLSAFPVELQLAPAPGNFMGRVHVARRHAINGRFLFEGDEQRASDVSLSLVGRGDELVSPTAMLVESNVEGQREAIVTLGHFGDERGAPLVDVPYGRGAFRIVGLPLLELVHGRADPARERVLAELMTIDLGEHFGAERAERPQLAATIVSALEVGSDLVEQVVALGDRLSPVTSAGQRPVLAAEFRTALRLRNEALTAAIEGRAPAALELLEQAVRSVVTEEAKSYIALEARVLSALAELSRTSLDLEAPLADASADWDLAVNLLEHWVRASAHWAGGERELGIDWLGSANLLLENAKGADFPAQGDKP